MPSIVPPHSPDQRSLQALGSSIPDDISCTGASPESVCDVCGPAEAGGGAPLAHPAGGDGHLTPTLVGCDQSKTHSSSDRETADMTVEVHKDCEARVQQGVTRQGVFTCELGHHFGKESIVRVEK